MNSVPSPSSCQQLFHKFLKFGLLYFWQVRTRRPATLIGRGVCINFQELVCLASGFLPAPLYLIATKELRHLRISRNSWQLSCFRKLQNSYALVGELLGIRLQDFLSLPFCSGSWSITPAPLLPPSTVVPTR